MTPVICVQIQRYKENTATDSIGYRLESSCKYQVLKLHAISEFTETLLFWTTVLSGTMRLHIPALRCFYSNEKKQNKGMIYSDYGNELGRLPVMTLF